MYGDERERRLKFLPIPRLVQKRCAGRIFADGEQRIAEEVAVIPEDGNAVHLVPIAHTFKGDGQKIGVFFAHTDAVDLDIVFLGVRTGIFDLCGKLLIAGSQLVALERKEPPDASFFRAPFPVADDEIDLFSCLHDEVKRIPVLHSLRDPAGSDARERLRRVAVCYAAVFQKKPEQLIV